MDLNDNTIQDLLNKLSLNVASTSNDKNYFEEPYPWRPQMDYTDILAETIPSAANRTEADNNVTNYPSILEKLTDYVLTEAPASNGQGYALHLTPGDTTSDRYVNLILPQKYGEGYVLILKENDGTPIALTEGAYQFDYANGIIRLDNTHTAAQMGWATPLKITVYHYKGQLLKDVLAGLTGSLGATGWQGATGLQGITGLIGPTGIQGVTGLAGVGATGLQGVTGLAGVGVTGLQGLTGEQGVQGDKGDTGDTGDQGVTGIRGETGELGSTGATGIGGDTGVMGVTGLVAPAGTTGLLGPTGYQGDTGVSGPTGIQGETGLQGLTGLVGHTGIPGLLGLTGLQGQAADVMRFRGVISEDDDWPSTALNGDFYTITSPTAVSQYGYTFFQGEEVVWRADTGLPYDGEWILVGTRPDLIQGHTGIAGFTGAHGEVGPDGATGIAGPTGIAGFTGVIGGTGAAGVTGLAGQIGIQGDTGLAGLQGSTGLSGDTGLQGVTGDAGVQGETGTQGVTGQTGGIPGQELWSAEVTTYDDSWTTISEFNVGECETTNVTIGVWSIKEDMSSNATYEMISSFSRQGSSDITEVTLPVFDTIYGPNRIWQSRLLIDNGQYKVIIQVKGDVSTTIKWRMEGQLNRIQGICSSSSSSTSSSSSATGSWSSSSGSSGSSTSSGSSSSSSWSYEIDQETVLLLHNDGDQSDSQHAVTFNGGVKLSAAHSIGRTSAYFNGSTAYMSIPNDADFNLTADFTIDCWVNTGSFGANESRAIIEGGDANSGLAWLFNLLSDGSSNVRLELDYWTGSWEANPSDTISFSADTWHHVALARSGTSLRFYLDGVDVGGGTRSTSYTTAGPNYIGQNYNSSNFFPGYIDEIRLSKGIARWTSGFTPESSPYESDSYTKLLLHMEGDYSGYGHEVTTVGDPVMNAATTKFDGSYYFDGNDYLTVPDSDDWTFGSGDFTIDLWVRFTTVQTSIFAQQWGADGLKSWQYYFYNNNLYFLWSTDGNAGTQTQVNVAWTPSTGIWYHLAVAREGTNLYFFVNGAQQGTTQIINATLFDSSTTMFIGSEGGTGNFLAGYMDEFRISKGIARWTSDFSPDNQPYPYGSSSSSSSSSATTPPNPGFDDPVLDAPNLIAVWKLDETSGTRYDSVGSYDLADVNTVGYSALGKDGNCADFEKANSESLVDADADISRNKTVMMTSMWVKFETVGGGGGDAAFLQVEDDDDGNSRWQVYSVDQNLNILMRFDKGGAIIETSSNTFSVGPWYNIVALIDTTTNKIYGYVNGSQWINATRTMSNFSNYATWHGLRLGSWPNGSTTFLDGLLDEVYVWDSAPASISAFAAATYNSGAGKFYNP